MNRDTLTNYFDDGWYRTGDVGELDSEGYLRIKGRTKNMILSASGMNVYPEDIEAELNRTAGVKEACVLGREQGGQTVIHAVLLLNEDGGDGKAIIQAANANLADHQKIQTFSVWDKPDFPRTTTMKVQRRFVLEALHAQPGGETEASTDPAAERDPIYDIIRSLSKVPAERIVPAATPGLDLQIDSLSRVELVGIIEEELRVELDESLITEQTTIAELEAFVASQQKASGPKHTLWPLTPWVICLRRLLQFGFIRPMPALKK
jgi:long-chain acyl-CoA synthetase